MRAGIDYKFPIGALLRCRQTGTEMKVVGVPAHTAYLPTDEPIYLCAEDSMECRLLGIPKEDAERDLEMVAPHPLAKDFRGD